MKTFVTFGSAHIHELNGQVFDKDCVAVIESNSAQDGRELAFQYFGNKFCFEYPEEFWEDSKMSWFPRGYINVEGDPPDDTDS